MTKFSIQKMMLQSALKKVGATEIKMQYIFATKSVQVTAGEKSVKDSIPSTLSDMALKKIASKYPNGKFLSLVITDSSISGECLNNDGTKEIINFSF